MNTASLRKWSLPLAIGMAIVLAVAILGKYRHVQGLDATNGCIPDSTIRVSPQQQQ